MKGQDQFTRQTASRIRALIGQVRNAPYEQQKNLRQQMRELGFYISDFPPRTWSGFTVDDFDELVQSGRIKVTD